MEVIGEGHFIIENVDGINESVNDLALIVGIVDVAKLETGNPIYDLGLGVARALDLSLCNAQLEALFCSSSCSSLSLVDSVRMPIWMALSIFSIAFSHSANW